MENLGNQEASSRTPEEGKVSSSVEDDAIQSSLEISDNDEIQVLGVEVVESK